MAPRKPRPDLRDLKERAILEAAARVFAERGLRGTRMADIATRAGIGKGTVYEYFRSKEDLFLRLFHWYTGLAITSMKDSTGDDDSPALARLRSCCDSLLASCLEIMDMYPLTMEFWSASTAPEYRDDLTVEFRRLYEQFRGVISGLLRAGMARGEIGAHVDPEKVAAVLIGAFDGAFLQAWFDPDFDPVAAGRHFLDVLIVGLRPGGESRTSEDPT
jgi:AcrR family transcriptional regulator